MHDQRCRLLVAVILFLCASSGLWAQPSGPSRPVFTEEPNWQAICKTAIAQPLPTAAEALAQAASKARKKPCDERHAYFGFEKPPDYSEALRCAYLHRANQKMPSEVEIFDEGPAILAMLYANGYGVPRNYELALRFECEAAGQSPSEESSLNIGQLEALRDGKQPHEKPFDICDNAVSGAMGSYCDSLSEQKADVGRARRLKELRSRLPQAAQAMLPKLQVAETAFEKARGEGEYSGGGGSGSAGFEEADQGQLREQFLINLRRFAAGDLPKATAADRAQAEQQVKAAADAAQAFKPDPNIGPREPTPQSLAATEQAWQALWTAWMRFVPVAYPQLSTDVAATELLRLRLHQLKRVSPPD